MFRNQNGLSLIGLVIIVVIIGVLAAIAVPKFIAEQDLRKEALTRDNMRTVQLAVEDFGADNNGYYPISNLELGGYLPDGFQNPWRDEGNYIVVLEPDTVSRIPHGMVRVSVTKDGLCYRIRGGNHEDRPLMIWDAMKAHRVPFVLENE